MIRVTKEQSAATRERILDEAARLFRERGFDGIGVADLMKRVGLTHGGFYGHFASKEDLMAEACQRAVSTMLVDWHRITDKAAADPMTALTNFYLSIRHRDQAGTGCLMAAVGPEVSRQAAPVRRVVTDCLDSVLAFLARLSPGKSAAAKRKNAVANFASMVGALVVARAVNDPKLSKEVLQIVAESIAKANDTR
jgi:TetR/AcrR family transcriptional repressor of nem operon